MQIVKFEDGKFAVRRRLFFVPEYLYCFAKFNDFVWVFSRASYRNGYIFDTLGQAKEAFEKYAVFTNKEKVVKKFKVEK